MRRSPRPRRAQTRTVCPRLAAFLKLLLTLLLRIWLTLLLLGEEKALLPARAILQPRPVAIEIRKGAHTDVLFQASQCAAERG